MRYRMRRTTFLASALVLSWAGVSTAQPSDNALPRKDTAFRQSLQRRGGELAELTSAVEEQRRDLEAQWAGIQKLRQRMAELQAALSKDSGPQQAALQEEAKQLQGVLQSQEADYSHTLKHFETKVVEPLRRDIAALNADIAQMDHYEVAEGQSLFDAEVSTDPARTVIVPLGSSGLTIGGFDVAKWPEPTVREALSQAGLPAEAVEAIVKVRSATGLAAQAWLEGHAAVLKAVTPAVQKKVFERTYALVQQDVQAVFPGMNQYPESAREALVEIALILGKAKLSGWQKLQDAVAGGDWALAAERSRIVGIADARNQKIRALFEASANRPVHELVAPASELEAPTAELAAPAFDLDTLELDAPNSELVTPKPELVSPTPELVLP